MQSQIIVYMNPQSCKIRCFPCHDMPEINLSCSVIKETDSTSSFKAKVIRRFGEKKKKKRLKLSHCYFVLNPKTGKHPKLLEGFHTPSTKDISKVYYKTAAQKCSFCLTEFHFRQGWSTNPRNLRVKLWLFHIRVISDYKGSTGGHCCLNYLFSEHLCRLYHLQRVCSELPTQNCGQCCWGWEGAKFNLLLKKLVFSLRYTIKRRK